jgi:hypothetical protein
VDSEPFEDSLKSELQIAIEKLSAANLDPCEMSTELNSLEALSQETHELVTIAEAWLMLIGGELGSVEAKRLLVNAEEAADSSGDWPCCIGLLEKLPGKDDVNQCLTRRWLNKAEEKIDLSFDAELCAVSWVRLNVEDSKKKAFTLLKNAEELLKQEILDFCIDPSFAAKSIQDSWVECFGEELGKEYSEDLMAWVEAVGDEPWFR